MATVGTHWGNSSAPGPMFGVPRRGGGGLGVELVDNHCGESSLYEFLVELFGERLVLRLSHHYSYNMSLRTPKRTTPSWKKAEEGGNRLPLPKLQAVVDYQFKKAQPREGFHSVFQSLRQQQLVALPTSSRIPRGARIQPFSLKKYRISCIPQAINQSPSFHGRDRRSGRRKLLVNLLCSDPSCCWL